MKSFVHNALTVTLLAVAVSGCSTSMGHWVSSGFSDNDAPVYQSSPGATPEAAYGEAHDSHVQAAGNMRLNANDDAGTMAPVMSSTVATSNAQAYPPTTTVKQNAGKLRPMRETISPSGKTIIGGPIDHSDDDESRTPTGPNIELSQLTVESQEKVNQGLTRLESGHRTSWLDHGTHFQLRVDTYPTSNGTGQVCRQAALIFRTKEADENDWQTRTGVFCRSNPQSPWYFAHAVR